MFLSAAIAAPTTCTSRASRCFSTIAASSSPSDSSRIAARCAPLMLFTSRAIGGYPVLHDLRDLARVFRSDPPCHADLLFVVRGSATCGQRPAVVAIDFAGYGFMDAGALLGAGQWARAFRGGLVRAQQAAQHRPQQSERQQQRSQYAEPLLDQVHHAGALPERGRRRVFRRRTMLERLVDHA